MLDSIVNSIKKSGTIKVSGSNTKKGVTKSKKQTAKKQTSDIVVKKAKIDKPIIDSPNNVIQEDVSDNALDKNNEVNEVNEVNKINEPSFFESIMKNVDANRFSISEAEKSRVMEYSRDVHDSLLGIIRRCDSNTCRQKNLCPFACINKFPENQLCPVEMSIAKFASKEYYQMLEDELMTNKFNIIEISTINALIEVELEEFRSRAYIHETGLITQVAAFVIKETGGVVYNDVENPVYNLRERLDRRKAKLLQRLLLTPESRARFKLELKSKSNKTTKDLISSAEDKIKQFAIE